MVGERHVSHNIAIWLNILADKMLISCVYYSGLKVLDNYRVRHKFLLRFDIFDLRILVQISSIECAVNLGPSSLTTPIIFPRYQDSQSDRLSQSIEKICEGYQDSCPGRLHEAESMQIQWPVMLQHSRPEFL